MLETANIPLQVLALFDKRFKGDDALLRLAALRFKQAGLGAEFYGESPAALERLLSYRPSHSSPATVHLSRDINIFWQDDRRLILDFAARFRGRIMGFIVHDQAEAAHRFREYTQALREIGAGLKNIDRAPYIFIEYASGLDIELYVDLFRAIHDIAHISSCIDTGHVGLWQARKNFAEKHEGKDVFSIRPNSPELPDFVSDIQEAVQSSINAVLHAVGELARLGKPLHFHLHDGHPLSTFSPYGVSDHLSFLTEIPIPFEYEGRELLHPMFGPRGLSNIVSDSLRLLGPGRITFCLEIHPPQGRLPLGDTAYLFSHWADSTNAERMNYWLSVLRANQFLLSGYAAQALGT